MRHVFSSIGTVVSVQSDIVPSAVETVFAAYDERFSLYRDDSELTVVNERLLGLRQSSDTLREVYGLALQWSERTSGTFTPHRPDGAIDLNGVVKALAIQGAGELLGDGRWCINAGGDILVSGEAWTVGIVDPHDRDALLLSVQLTAPRRALATSGSAERGDHIWRGGTTAEPEFVQVSVVANDIVTADVLATTIVAGGREALNDLTARFPIDVVTVGRDGSLLATPGIRSALAKPEVTPAAR